MSERWPSRLEGATRFACRPTSYWVYGPILRVWGANPTINLLYHLPSPIWFEIFSSSTSWGQLTTCLPILDLPSSCRSTSHIPLWCSSQTPTLTNKLRTNLHEKVQFVDVLRASQSKIKKTSRVQQGFVGYYDTRLCQHINLQNLNLFTLARGDLTPLAMFCDFAKICGRPYRGRSTLQLISTKYNSHIDHTLV